MRTVKESSARFDWYQALSPRDKEKFEDLKREIESEKHYNEDKNDKRIS